MQDIYDNGHDSLYETLPKLSDCEPPKRLREKELNTFRMAFKHVPCVIIDDISTMSSDQLNAIDIRLGQLTEKYCEPFRGFDMTLCGDLYS